jgi:2'-5' RNA ligase
MPDTAERARMSAAAADLDLGPDVRPVAAVNYHLTVAFVGDVAAGQEVALRGIGRAQRARRSDACFDAYEYWPKPEVVVAAARVIPPALQELWQHLHADLAAGDFALNPKRLRPHVTLARKVSQTPALPAICAFHWSCRQLCLMRADGAGDERVYTVVEAWPLLDESPT